LLRTDTGDGNQDEQDKSEDAKACVSNEVHEVFSFVRIIERTRKKWLSQDSA
jgi:hypothetical protein